ncbi:histidine phosphatase family protein [Paenibacillus jilunlii]|uniref:Phosphoglycerate mutase n=1 Tax=Paenibacillus jilunlii TaxID=682956 RepID=A0A1G9LBQ0_9BACL|nr:histidine phosphatase family protein [Paenibacillus jilunlii]KWX74170.1 phosphoglycerate mutase [Paenibacillus jilunlii]SDL59391.1 2,3-bisphosphoglycerate-dependent phosphoglycerate mutase [Paenibacillus jilunlii]
MRTIVCLIRHAESLYVEGQERERGLSEQGKSDAVRIKSILQKQPIDLFVSSPYARAIQTIQPLAEVQQNEILLMENLRERTIGNIAELSFVEAKRRVYQDFAAVFEGGESSAEAQARAVGEFKLLLEKYEGKTLVVGTHGDIMTLLMNYFDCQYGYDFWQSTTMPDIYRLEFKGRMLAQVRREWEI